MFSLATAAHSYYLSSAAGGAGGEGKVNCIHSTWGRAVKFYVQTKYDLDPHRAASNPAQVSSAPARAPGTGREVRPRLGELC